MEHSLWVRVTRPVSLVVEGLRKLKIDNRTTLPFTETGIVTD